MERVILSLNKLYVRGFKGSLRIRAQVEAVARSPSTKCSSGCLGKPIAGAFSAPEKNTKSASKVTGTVPSENTHTNKTYTLN